MVGSPGVVVMGRDSCSKGYGFESWHHILNWHFFTFICWKNWNDVCLKRPKVNDKRGQFWPIKNLFLEKIKISSKNCFNNDNRTPVLQRSLFLRHARVKGRRRSFLEVHGSFPVYSKWNIDLAIMNCQRRGSFNALYKSFSQSFSQQKFILIIFFFGHFESAKLRFLLELIRRRRCGGSN